TACCGASTIRRAPRRRCSTSTVAATEFSRTTIASWPSSAAARPSSTRSPTIRSARSRAIANRTAGATARPARCTRPTSPSRATLTYDASGDRTSVTRAYPTGTDVIAYVPGTSRIDHINRASGSVVQYSYDAYGNRIGDDDSAYADDARSFAYDDRNNLASVR